MKLTQFKIIEWFLRLSLSAGFLSAVADRFGLWRKDLSAWGNWDNFIAYTKTLNPLVPQPLISVLGGVATALEVIFAIALLTNYKTVFFAKVYRIFIAVVRIGYDIFHKHKGAT